MKFMKLKNAFIAFSVITVISVGILSFMLSATSADKRSDEPETGQLIAQANPEVPPFVQEMLDKRGISPEDLQNNPEMRAKVLEGMKKARGERGSRPRPGKAGGSKKASKKGDGEFAYYKEIVDNNLFRPLGWGPKKEGDPFVLRATMHSPNIPSASKAIVWVRAGNKERTVTIGDELGGVVVEAITDDSVTLQKDGKPIELSTGGLVFLGGPASKGGRKGKSSGGKKPQQAKRSGGGRRGPDKGMQEKFRQMSSEDRRRMAEQMRRRGGSRSGGRRRGGGGRGGDSSRRQRRR